MKKRPHAPILVWTVDYVVIRPNLLFPAQKLINQ